eukprot:5608648-Prymnesium_polylepis.3
MSAMGPPRSIVRVRRQVYVGMAHAQACVPSAVMRNWDLAPRLTLGFCELDRWRAKKASGASACGCPARQKCSKLLAPARVMDGS